MYLGLQSMPETAQFVIMTPYLSLAGSERAPPVNLFTVTTRADLRVPGETVLVRENTKFFQFKLLHLTWLS